MRKSLSIFATLLVLGMSSSSQDTHDQVTLRAEISSQQYCAVDEEIASLRVIFGIKLANKENAPLWVNSRLGGIALVSRTLEDARAGRYEFEFHAPDSFQHWNSGPNGSSKPLQGPEYSKVSPNQTLNKHTEPSTLIVAMPGYNGPDALSPGTHFVQLKLETQAYKGSKRMKLVSQPVPINIQVPAEMPDCSDLNGKQAAKDGS